MLGDQFLLCVGATPVAQPVTLGDEVAGEIRVLLESDTHDSLARLFCRAEGDHLRPLGRDRSVAARGANRGKDDDERKVTRNK